MPPDTPPSCGGADSIHESAPRVILLRGGGHRVIGLAHGDDLAVADLQAEPKLAGLVLVHLERACLA